jgi:hypothetical protein
MINYQKSVFDKLFKEESVELSKVEIELKGVKELQEMYAKLQEIANTANASRRLAEQAATALANDGKSLRMRTDEFTKAFTQFENDAKAMGLEMPNNIKQLKSFAKGYSDQSGKMLKAASTIEGASNTLK